MSSQIRFPSAAISLANAGTGGNAEAWPNPTNVLSDNAVEATITAATYDTGDVSGLLVASGFGFTIPSDQFIHGIVLEIERRCNVGAASDFRVQLGKDVTFAGLVGENKGDVGGAWPAVSTVRLYGGEFDQWDALWTPAEVNSASFAAFLSAQATADDTDLRVDFFRVTVYYATTPPIPFDALNRPDGKERWPWRQRPGVRRR